MKVSSFLKEVQFQCCLPSHQDIIWNTEWYSRLKLGFHVALIITEPWAYFFHLYLADLLKKKFFFKLLRGIPERAMAPHSGTLTWKIPRMEEPGGLQSMGSLRVGHDWATSLSLFTFTFHFHASEKEMATTPVFLPGESQGTAEPVGLPSMGLHRVRHDWSDLAGAAARGIPGGATA